MGGVRENSYPGVGEATSFALHFQNYFSKVNAVLKEKLHIGDETTQAPVSPPFVLVKDRNT